MRKQEDHFFLLLVNLYDTPIQTALEELNKSLVGGTITVMLLPHRCQLLKKLALLQYGVFFLIKMSPKP